MKPINEEIMRVYVGGGITVSILATDAMASFDKKKIDRLIRHLEIMKETLPGGAL